MRSVEFNWSLIKDLINNSISILDFQGYFILTQISDILTESVRTRDQ